MFKIEVDNINGKSESLYVYGEHSLLTELEAHNIFINHSCRQGHCGSCIIRLIAGQVEHRPPLLPLGAGEILACQSKPVSDIKITNKD